MTATATSNSASSARSGFTLLEVMVALAVVAFAFVGLVGLHGRNIQLVDRANKYSRAVLLARELMTQLHFEDVVNLTDGGGVFESYPQFRWERSVDPTTFETVKRVRVRVIWDDRSPTACELLYYVAQPDG
jgi:general secretion pathway protein I